MRSHGGRVSAGDRWKSSVSACCVTVRSHGELVSVGSWRESVASTCGVTDQSHGGKIAQAGVVVWRGICLWCDCGVAWLADCCRVEDCGGGIWLRCDWLVARQVDVGCREVEVVGICLWCDFWVAQRRGIGWLALWFGRYLPAV